MRIRELFNPLPGNRYLEVATKVDELSHLLLQILQDVDGALNIVLYSSDKNKQDIKAKIEFVSDTKSLFRAMPREHDMVVIKDVFAMHEDKNALLSLTYRTLANTAHIIILEKKGLLDIKKTKEMLEDFEFRAANEIDIVDGYDLIMAKKLHMWGNGL